MKPDTAEQLAHSETVTETGAAGDPVPRPERNRPATTDRKLVRAAIYGVLAVLLTIACIATMAAVNPLVGAFVFVPAFYLGRSSLRHFKERHEADTFDIEDLGDRAPVLFLRPFELDDGQDGAAPFNLYNPWTWRKFPFTPSNFRTLYLEMTGRSSFEQVLAYYVKGAGPLIAFGEPGQPPILGATNFYMRDANWKEQVIKIAGQSAIVVVSAGTTEGVLWEVETMVGQVSPDRFVLNIPGSSKGQRKAIYAEFREAAAHNFPNGLPEDVKGARFLLFDDEWNARLGKIRGPARHSPAWIVKRMNQTLI